MDKQTDKINLGGFPNIQKISKENNKVNSFSKKIINNKNLLNNSNLLSIKDILDKKIK
jgi:hypothetical protein